MLIIDGNYAIQFSVHKQKAINKTGPIIAVIPARGGSQRFPRKNIALLDGIPLITHTIRNALRAKTIDIVCVSTEDPEIADIAKTENVLLVHRPIELAGSKVQNQHVVSHALSEIYPNKEEGIVMLLQPTSPLRHFTDIDETVTLFQQDQAARSCLSITFVDTHPGKFITLDGNKIHPYTCAEDMEKQMQNLPPVYQQNGAIYMLGIEDFKKHQKFILDPAIAYIMPPERSVDIDKEENLLYAQILLNYAKEKTHNG